MADMIPRTREEKYLAKMAGQNVTLPEEDVTRKEQYYRAIIELLEEGGGGGSSTAYATALSLTINPATFVMTGQLLNKDGDPLGTAQTIDLPLESVVVNGSYDAQTKKVILTLQNGNTIDFSVADLVSGLQTEITSQNKLSADLVDDTSATNKFVTSADKTKLSKAITTDEITVESNYTQLPNQPRVYTSATEPTGTIPDGSIWLGGVPVPGMTVDTLYKNTTGTAESNFPVTLSHPLTDYKFIIITVRIPYGGGNSIESACVDPSSFDFPCQIGLNGSYPWWCYFSSATSWSSIQEASLGEYVTSIIGIK